METDKSPVSGTLGDEGIYSSIEDLKKWGDAFDYHNGTSVECRNGEYRSHQSCQPELDKPRFSLASYGADTDTSSPGVINMKAASDSMLISSSMR